MSKIEIAGPKDLLEDALSYLQEKGIFHIEPELMGFIDGQECINSLLSYEKEIPETFFLRNLRTRIEVLFTLLPEVPVRKSYIEPASVVDNLSHTIRKHTETCKELSRRREALRKELAELSVYSPFLDKVDSLLRGMQAARDIDFVGLTLKDRSSVPLLNAVLARITDRKFELITDVASDGTLVGLIATGKGVSEKVKRALEEKNIPELRLPQGFGDLSFPDKIIFLKARIRDTAEEIEQTGRKLELFAHRWKPVYEAALEWINDRLSVLKATSCAFETEMCFFIHGWVASAETARLRGGLAERFAGKVILQEKEIREEDFERVPIVLYNRAYFRSFELLTRALPLPGYLSYDPTPFIGIFFPVFFGMILGDTGYGLILAAVAVVLMKKFRGKRKARDAAVILLTVSLYSIVFGVLYGEFFGNLGQKMFGMEPLWIERQTSLMPMLVFAISVGVVHVSLGLLLGSLSAFRKKSRKEALFKFVNVLVILSFVALIACLFEVFPVLFRKPLIISILVLTAVLIFTGGFLAPLELLKSMGNIVSYARIMAIGLTSVVLAFVANRIAGLTGDIVTGIIAAGLLHLLNIIIGVFSPAIHSLRLHYVEFFGKFIEPGGRRFDPLKKGGRGA